MIAGDEHRRDLGPSKAWGRVNCGYSSNPCSKLSSVADSSAPRTPGIRRTQASIRAMAATSPPASTKSPRDTSSIRRALMIRSSSPSNRAQNRMAPAPSASSRTRSWTRGAPRGERQSSGRDGPPPAVTASIAAAATSARITMPGPPPAGVSSTRPVLADAVGADVVDIERPEPARRAPCRSGRRRAGRGTSPGRG